MQVDYYYYFHHVYDLLASGFSVTSFGVSILTVLLSKAQVIQTPSFTIYCEIIGSAYWSRAASFNLSNFRLCRLQHPEFPIQHWLGLTNINILKATSTLLSKHSYWLQVGVATYEHSDDSLPGRLSLCSGFLRSETWI